MNKNNLEEMNNLLTQMKELVNQYNKLAEDSSIFNRVGIISANYQDRCEDAAYDNFFVKCEKNGEDDKTIQKKWDELPEEEKEKLYKAEFDKTYSDYGFEYEDRPYCYIKTSENAGDWFPSGINC